MGVPFEDMQEKISKINNDELREELAQIVRNRKAADSLAFSIRQSLNNIIETIGEYDKEMMAEANGNPHVLAASVALKGVTAALQKEAVRLGREVIRISKEG